MSGINFLAAPVAKKPSDQFDLCPASHCTSTGLTLRDPVIASCSHLFEKCVLDNQKITACPKCKYPIDWYVPCAELKQKIAQLYPLQEEKKIPNQVLINKEQEKVIWKVNAHKDDIHGLLRISPGRFVSGSKDTTLKIWDSNGQCLNTLEPKEKQGYKFWVTALAKMGDKWISGSRDGRITLWDLTGKEIRTFYYQPSFHSKNQTVCKDRNKNRINCIFENPAVPNTFFTGTPKYIQLWNADGKMLNYVQAHNNDWVYCIDSLGGEDLIVVIGSIMQIWKKNKNDNGYEKSFLIDEVKQKSIQRLHISAIVKLQSNPKQLASALFDGSVRIVDLQKQCTICSYEEHLNRVWSVVNLSANHFASSADDKKIKIWDLRQKSSVHTISNQPGRVSCLLEMGENKIISASCPDNPFQSKEQGTLTFWDLRFLKQ